MNNGARGVAHGHTVEAARALRPRQTCAEDLLWEELRDRKLGGIKFRRQHPYDKFILDFFCPCFQLAIEIDGPVHDDTDQRNYDEARAAFLFDRGVRVLRFRNEEIEQSLGQVLEVIRAATIDRTRAANRADLPSPIRR